MQRFSNPHFRDLRTAGFSLAEVSVALAILAIALVALLGLLSPGLDNFRSALSVQTTAEKANNLKEVTTDCMDFISGRVPFERLSTASM